MAFGGYYCFDDPWHVVMNGDYCFENAVDKLACPGNFSNNVANCSILEQELTYWDNCTNATSL